MDDFSNRDRLRLIVCDWLLTSYGSEITAAAEDIQILFDRCLHYVQLDEGASLADQRKILDKLTPEAFRDGVTIDDAVKARIGMFLKGGAISLFDGNELPDDAALRRAIGQARMSLEPIPRRRPAGTLSLVAQQLALGLATIWKDWTGQKAKRSVLLDNKTGRYAESGAFHAFVSHAVAIAPPALRKPRKGQLPSIDHLVRLAKYQSELAEASDVEEFRRGLLDERLWLGESSA